VTASLRLERVIVLVEDDSDKEDDEAAIAGWSCCSSSLELESGGSLTVRSIETGISMSVTLIAQVPVSCSSSSLPLGTVLLSLSSSATTLTLCLDGDSGSDRLDVILVKRMEKQSMALVILTL